MRPFVWVSTLYFGEGLPYALVAIVSAIFYKSFHIANEKIAFFTSLLFLPWSLKPVWAPFLEMYYSKKQWIVIFQMAEAVLLFLVAFVLFSPQHFFYSSFILLFIFSFCASSYDIVSDGYYMFHLNAAAQQRYLGVCSLNYQLARVFTQGGLLIAVGYLTYHFQATIAWQMFFIVLALLFFLLALWHCYSLSASESLEAISHQKIISTFSTALKSFLTIPSLGIVLLFLLVFNAADAQLIKIVPLFLLGSSGGLTTADVGFVYGTCAGIAMTLGAVLGGFWLNRFGLKTCLKLFTLLMVLTSINYILLSYLAIKTLWLIVLLMVIPSFCFGLANSAYMAFLLFTVAPLKFRTTCYALGTGIMLLCYFLFGACSGFLQHHLGYVNFFIFIFFLELAIYFLTCIICRKINFNRHFVAHQGG
ncbi:MAG: AmpG family muropeptide transporter [Gammaproteobacteria bacterium]|nr:AmpG family muropeptide transporter [Gammaproteobacteria bacterium]